MMLTLALAPYKVMRQSVWLSSDFWILYIADHTVLIETEHGTAIIPRLTVERALLNEDVERVV